MGSRVGRALLAAVIGITILGPGQAAATVAPPSPEPAIPPAAVSPTVDLGKYAVNGTVRAAVVDRTTGNTYLGGNFTSVGLRTGSVTVVDLPDVSDGTAHPGPEVLGTIVAAFADERPGDPGFFIVGHVAAINGVAVPRRLAYRIHLSGGAWVLDPGWIAEGDCNTGNQQFPQSSPWIVTPTLLIGGGYAGPGAMSGSSTGLTVIDRATGLVKAVGGNGCDPSHSLLPAIPMLPALTGCAGQDYCYAMVNRLTYDPTSNRVLVDYAYVVGSTGSVQPTQWAGLAAYDLTAGTGGRTWLRALHTGSLGPYRDPFVMTMGSLPGAFLLRGYFPLDATVAAAQVSRLLLVDAATGEIRQRWNSLGEQDPANGTTSGPGTSCETSTTAPGESGMGRFGGEAYGWLEPSRLCRYRLVAGALDSATVGSVSLDFVRGRRMPSMPYTSPGGIDYLLGSDAAVNLDTGTLTTWEPDPAVNPNAEPLSVAVVAGKAIIAGEFSFVRGVPSYGIVGFDSAMVPLAGFVSPLHSSTEPSEGVNALALTDGRLIVGGSWLGAPGLTSLLAVNSATGQADPWHPSSTLPVIVDSIVVAPTGDFWIGGFSDLPSPAVALQHYAAFDDGGALLGAPAIGCLPATAGIGTSTPTCDPAWTGRARVRSLLLDDVGRLYLAGGFGSVDGVARRGLARLEADGSVAAWDPDLYGTLPMPSNASLVELEPHSLALLGDRLVVGGRFRYGLPISSGGLATTAISPLLIYSVSSGALLRPTDPARMSWFPVPSWWMAGYSMVHTDGGLLVALGPPGMAVFDPTTLDLDVSASAPFYDTNWMSPLKDAGVFALAMPFGSEPLAAAPAGAARTTAAVAPGRVVIAGAIPRWNNRVAGNVVRITVGADITRPTTSVPRVVPAASLTLTSSTVPARVSWVGADPRGSGVARYELGMSVAGAPYVSLGTQFRTPAANAILGVGRTYRFRVRAIDYAGNVGLWTYSPTLTDLVTQQTSAAVRYSSGWTTSLNTQFLGGSVKGRSVIGATASYTFSGRGIGFVTTFGPTRGRVKVYIDGRYVRTIDMYAKAYRFRVVAFSTSWSTVGTHTIRLVLNGPSTRARFDLDGFALIR